MGSFALRSCMINVLKVGIHFNSASMVCMILWLFCGSLLCNSIGRNPCVADTVPLCRAAPDICCTDSLCICNCASSHPEHWAKGNHRRARDPLGPAPVFAGGEPSDAWLPVSCPSSASESLSSS